MLVALRLAVHSVSTLEQAQQQAGQQTLEAEVPRTRAGAGGTGTSQVIEALPALPRMMGAAADCRQPRFGKAG